MDFTISNSLAGSLTSLTRGQAAKIYAPALPATLPAKPAHSAPADLESARTQQTGTRLVSEQRDDLDGGGYRLTRTFEREDGRTFTKVEEFALTSRGSRRTVLQQNPSGSITRYEEVLDREDDGNFRRTQRFQDGTGEVSTQITTGYKVTDAFILTGSGAYTPQQNPPPAFAPYRGTQLDLSA